MPAYMILYSRKDMPNRCKAIKFAHDPKSALDMLKDTHKKKNVYATNFEIKEMK